MTEFLIRTFIKDYTAIHRPEVRSAYGILSGAAGIFCNTLLFLLKLTVGLMLRSISVLSDAFNNLSDAASSVISLVGVHLSEKPADQEHPYGHGRIEYIAALIVSFLVLEVGMSFLKSSLSKIRQPEEMKFSIVSLLLLCFSVAVKLWMLVFNRKLGRRIDSKIMEATAADSAGDVLATSATIFSLILYGAFGINIDGWIGLVVSLVILWAGFGIARDTLSPLIGEPATEEERNMIRQIVESHPEILGSHDLLIHHYGPTMRMATIHAEMDNRKTLAHVHHIADQLERQVQEETDIRLVIHVDPVETKDSAVLASEKLAEKCIREQDSRLHMHDFQMIHEDGQDFISLDLEIPYQLTPEEADRVAASILTQIKMQNPGAEVAINIDRCS